MRAHPPPLSHPRTATRTPANCLPGTSHLAVERCSRWRESTAVLAVDALSLVDWRGAPAQLVFADAPYQSGAGLAAVTALARLGALDNGAVIVLETGETETLDITDGSTPTFTMIEARNYGKAMLHFLSYQA